MIIKEFRLSPGATSQRLQLQSVPIAAVGENGILKVYAYADDITEASEYNFICLKTNEEFESELLSGYTYLGTALVSSSAGWGIFHEAMHIYYKRATALIPINNKEPDNNKFATAFETLKDVNYYLNTITKVHTPEVELEC